MFELFKNEIWRLRYWLIVGVLAYLTLTASYLYFNIYPSSGLMIGNINSVLFAISSLLLGLFQFRTYKNNNRWIYLINRPISTWKLGLILIGAAAVIILFQFVVTDLAITLLMDAMDKQIIDQRHYVQTVYIFSVAVSFYLCGVFIQLSHSKGGFLLLVLPILVIASLLFSGPVVWISIIVLLWLLFLVVTVVKANLSYHQNHLLTKVMTIIPIQLGLYFTLIMSLSFCIQLKYMLVDGAGIDRGWNEYFPNDVYQHVAYLEGNEQIALSLTTADDNHQNRYSSQLKHIETESIRPQIKYFAKPNQLPYQQNFQQLHFTDQQQQTEWTFSMDQMLFIGQNTKDSSIKRLGKPAAVTAAFDSVPIVLANGKKPQIITSHDIYQYDSTNQSLIHKFKVPDHETLLTGLIQSGSFLALLSTEHLYLFNRMAASQNLGMLSLYTVIKLPGAHENLSGIELAEMMDHTLINFLFGKKATRGLFPSEQITVELDHVSKTSAVIAQRKLNQGFGDYYYQMGWYLSPLGYLSVEYVLWPLLNPEPIGMSSPTMPIHLSSLMKTLILSMTLISVLMTFWISRNRAHSKVEIGLWMLLSCLTSVIGILTLLLLSNRKTTIKADTVQ